MDLRLGGVEMDMPPSGEMKMSMKTTKLFFGILTISLALLAQAQAQTSFTNGSFEIINHAPIPAGTGVILHPGDTWLTGWTLGGAGSDQIAVANGTCGGIAPYDGQQDIWWNGNNTPSGGSLSQTFTTTVGQSYTVAFALNQDGSGNMSLTATALASNGTLLASNYCVSTSGVWTLFKMAFLAVSTNTTLVFKDTSVDTVAVDLLFDDVTVTANPLTIFSSSFETVSRGDYGKSNTLLPNVMGASLEGWTVVSNQVAVVPNENLYPAYDGTNYLALAGGLISATIPTVFGQPYTLTYAYRGPGLVDWWPFEGDATDLIGANNGVITPTLTSVAAVVGQGFQFDGKYSQINFGTNTGNFGTNDFTIDYWMKTTGTSAGEAFLEQRVSCDGTYSFWQIDNGGGYAGPPAGYARLAVANGGNQPSYALTCTHTLNDGLWHHLGWVRKGADYYLYVDGLFNAHTNVGSVFNLSNGRPLMMGTSVCDSENGTVPYTGAADELDLWNRALTDVEIAALYQAGTNHIGKATAGSALPNCNLLVNGLTNTTLVTPAGGANWLTNTLYFIAVNSNTALALQGHPLGMLFDDFVMQTLPMVPHGASATAVFVNNFVVGAAVTDGGWGYTNTPAVRFIGGGGSGAQAVAVMSNGVVAGITVTNAGSGYTNAPLVVIDPPFVPNPVLGIAPLSFLTFSNLSAGGVYQLQQLAGWYWTNLLGNITATNSVFSQMVPGFVSGGNYRLALSPVPAQAFATPQVVDGFVVAATLTSGGSGYVTSPPVSIVGGGGRNAAGFSQISGGVVTNINITDAGIGYTNTPTVEIGPPPVTAVSPTVLLGMRVDSSNLAPYDNYQIQFTPVLGATWGNWNGGLFTPTDVTNSQYLLVTNAAGFFRLLSVP